MLLRCCDEGVEGVHRFLDRLWRTAADAAELPDEPAPAAGEGNADDYRILRKMFASMPLQKTAFGPEDIQVYVDGLSRPGASP